jgi:Cu(I)/Ag(I) efflux system membrane protein CusA/SilA
MIAALIRWSIVNRFLVLLATVMLTAWGVWACAHAAGRAARPVGRAGHHPHQPTPARRRSIVENQVTYPLTTTMLSVPGAKTVRGYSFFGDSFVYVLFEDGTDLYWARSRVLEYLNQVQGACRPRQSGARAGRHRRGLDLPVRAGRPQRQATTLASCARCRTGS